jgi:hypothetical protein
VSTWLVSVEEPSDLSLCHPLGGFVRQQVTYSAVIAFTATFAVYGQGGLEGLLEVWRDHVELSNARLTGVREANRRRGRPRWR